MNIFRKYLSLNSVHVHDCFNNEFDHDPLWFQSFRVESENTTNAYFNI